MFNFKRIKQKVAVALIVAMSVSATLPALAAGNAVEKIGQGNYDQKITTVKVKFDPGPGGYWTGPIATKANATVYGTTSDANREHMFEEPEISYPEGTPTNATPKGVITRKFTLRGWDEGSGSWEFADDDGYAYINLGRGDIWFPNYDWKKIANEDKNMKFNGWYYKDQLVDDDTAIYSGSTAEERDKGIELVAGWVNPDRVEVEENNYFTAHSVTDVAGLEEGQKLVVKRVEGEYADWEDDQDKIRTALADVLQQQADLNLNLNPDGKAGEDFIGIDIDVTNYVPDRDNHIAITLMAPEEFISDGNEQIYAVHFRSDGETEVIPVSLVRRESGRFDMCFTVTNGFSPFFFVKAQDSDKVKVTIENVKNGYLVAYTGDFWDATILPIGEPVELEKGTRLFFNDYGYYFDNVSWHGELDSITAKFADNTSEVLEDNYTYVVEKDCTLTAKFEQVEREENENDLFNVWVNPRNISQEGKFEGEVYVEKLTADGSDYEEFTGTLRMATAEDLAKNDINEYHGEDIAKFSFNSETHMLTSVGDLELGEYRIPFVITYEGKDYIVRYSDTDYEGTIHNNPYTVYINVGARLRYCTTLVNFGENYHDDISLYSKPISDNGSLKWKDAKPTGEDMARFRYGVPKMYNYSFEGWQDYQGKVYENDDQALVSRYTPARSYDIYSLFTDKDGKAYNGVKPSYDGEGPTTEDPENPTTPVNPGGSSSTSGGSGGRSRRNVDLTGNNTTYNHYTMTGSWIAGANGWKFLTSSGSYATNTWGLINNQWYFFDAAGNMVTGWYQVGGRWYYMNPAEGSLQGAMVVGWALDPNYNAWFFLTESGAMATDWQKIGDKWYYFNPISDGRKGAMAVNTYVGSDYVGSDGAWIPSN